MIEKFGGVMNWILERLNLEYENVKNEYDTFLFTNKDELEKIEKINVNLNNIEDALEKTNIKNTLSLLEDKKIIVYRKFKKAYSLFSGSDIDLEQVVELNKSKISGDTEIILSQLPTLQLVITKRHYHQTGTQRIYQKFCIGPLKLQQQVDLDQF